MGLPDTTAVPGKPPFLAGIFIALILLGVSGILLYVNTARLISVSTWVAASHGVMATQEELLSRLTEAENGLFGFIITGDEDFLSPYIEATTRIQELFERLKEADAPDLAQAERLDALHPLITQRLDLIEHRRRVRAGEGLEAVIQLVRKREAKEVMDALRSEISRMKLAQAELIRERKELALRSARITLAWVTGFGIFSVSLFGIIFLLLLHENKRRQTSERLLWNERNALDQRVRERTSDLAQTNQKLQEEIDERKKTEARLAELSGALAEKNKDLETLIYIASHDLRSPLVNIKGFSQELSRACDQLHAGFDGLDSGAEARAELGELVEKDMPESIHYILSATAKMDALLGGFLRYSRLGRAALEIEKVDMTRLLRDITCSITFQLQQKGVTFEMGSLPKCLGDATQLNHLFSNLLENALKYLDPSRPGIIRVSGRLENGRAIYAVTDNGVGISPNEQAGIFEIFHRAHPSIAPGDGLGLAIARKIVSRLQGKIWVESEPNRGSVFFVSLPAAEGKDGTCSK